MTITAYSVARTLVGTRERPGGEDHPFILWALSLVGYPDSHDETPWCSAFTAAVAFLCDLPRSPSAAARSWLTVGRPVSLDEATVGWDVVVLACGKGPQPGPDVVSGAPGHVGLFAGLNEDETRVRVLGGNQANGVSITTFPVSRVLGLRRLI
jgi:uncharacterized protein (TIGR02594 family)